MQRQKQSLRGSAATFLVKNKALTDFFLSSSAFWLSPSSLCAGWQAGDENKINHVFNVVFVASVETKLHQQKATLLDELVRMPGLTANGARLRQLGMGPYSVLWSRKIWKGPNGWRFWVHYIAFIAPKSLIYWISKYYSSLFMFENIYKYIKIH